jgi:hypothetical protein
MPTMIRTATTNPRASALFFICISYHERQFVATRIELLIKPCDEGIGGTNRMDVLNLPFVLVEKSVVPYYGEFCFHLFAFKSCDFQRGLNNFDKGLDFKNIKTHLPLPFVLPHTDHRLRMFNGFFFGVVLFQVP